MNISIFIPFSEVTFTATFSFVSYRFGLLFWSFILFCCYERFVRNYVNKLEFKSKSFTNAQRNHATNQYKTFWHSKLFASFLGCVSFKESNAKNIVVLWFWFHFISNTDFAIPFHFIFAHTICSPRQYVLYFYQWRTQILPFQRNTFYSIVALIVFSNFNDVLSSRFSNSDFRNL